MSLVPDIKYENLSDIELAVIVAKHIERIIDSYFIPEDKRGKRVVLGAKINSCSLQRDLKNIIVKNILYQRNDLVHSPGIDHFQDPKTRSNFIYLSKMIFRKLDKIVISQEEGGIETDGGPSDADDKALLRALSDSIIKSSRSLSSIIVEDSESLLSEEEVTDISEKISPQ